MLWSSDSHFRHSQDSYRSGFPVPIPLQNGGVNDGEPTSSEASELPLLGDEELADTLFGASRSTSIGWSFANR